MTLSGTKLTVDGTIEANSLTLSNTPVTATAEDLNKLGDITVSADKINYLSDVNSNVQTQINNRLTETQADALYSSINGNTGIQTVGTLTNGGIGVGFGSISTQNSITTTGTITGNEVKVTNVIMKGSTVGHTDKTDLLTLSSSALDVNGNVSVSGQMSTSTLKLGDTSITASGEDINKLASVTASASEINILKDVTGVTNTEINALSGVTSNIQSQLNDKLDTTSANSTYSLVTGHLSINKVGSLDTGSITSNFGNINIGDSNIDAGKITIDQIVIDGYNIGHTSDTDLLSLSSGKVTVAGAVQMDSLILGTTTVNADASDLNKLADITVSADKINYLGNVTSDINTDMDNRYTKTESDNTFAGINGTNTIVTVGALDSGSITSNFGSISTESTITTTSKITAGTLDAGSIKVSGANIGVSSDTDLITLSANKVNVAGALETTTLKLEIQK